MASKTQEAEDPEDLSASERANRSAGRTLVNIAFYLLLAPAALAGLAYYCAYELEPGQSALVFRLGKYQQTVSDPGLHFHLPTPIETHETVRVTKIQMEEFGLKDGEDQTASARLEAVMQTGDSNIVNISFVVTYFINDAFQSRYSLAEPIATLRDASQAALRAVVGRRDIDDVILLGGGELGAQARIRLQEVLDSYGSGITIERVALQEVQPPVEVQAAFEDVIAASQDGSRLVNEAEGYRNEAIPKARAEAIEFVASASAYRDSVVAKATGAASRFTALVDEYRKAPEVTRTRLYLETMETILPNVEKVIIEPGTTNVLPYLPLGRGRNTP